MKHVCDACAPVADPAPDLELRRLSVEVEYHGPWTQGKALLVTVRCRYADRLVQEFRVNMLDYGSPYDLVSLGVSELRRFTGARP